jgi:hypothetical protein
MVMEGILRAWKDSNRVSDLFDDEVGWPLRLDEELSFDRSFVVMRFCNFAANMATISVTGWYTISSWTEDSIGLAGVEVLDIRGWGWESVCVTGVVGFVRMIDVWDGWYAGTEDEWGSGGARLPREAVCTDCSETPKEFAGGTGVHWLDGTGTPPGWEGRLYKWGGLLELWLNAGAGGQ